MSRTCNEPDATSISDRGLFRLLAENLSPGVLRLLRHDLPCVDGSELARDFSTFAVSGRRSHVFGLKCVSHDRGRESNSGRAPILSSCTTRRDPTLSPQARRDSLLDAPQLQARFETRSNAGVARSQRGASGIPRLPAASTSPQPTARPTSPGRVRVSAQEPRHAFGEDRPARRLKLRQCSKVEAQLRLRQRHDTAPFGSMAFAGNSVR